MTLFKSRQHAQRTANELNAFYREHVATVHRAHGKWTVLLAPIEPTPIEHDWTAVDAQQG